MENKLQIFAFERILIAGATNCISTRKGGVSPGVFESMNLSGKTGDDPENIRQNYNILCDAMGFKLRSLVFSQQTHGTNIAIVDENTGELKDVDGLITNCKDVVLTTYFADCVPLFFYDPVKQVIGNAHAGWRGCANNMAGKMVEAMVSRFGCDPADTLAGIGPSISVKNFQVDADVADNFKNTLPFSSRFVYNSEGAGSKFHIDLWQICRESLILAGLKPENIETIGLCTYENSELFFSHRRDGLARGSMAGMISL
ncbi:MAG: peptidoglycan editing factor PgeF [Defluviitaleaceae bacterium]|nr:peptidoglycan editing factor PgeF [Defluviitaleaceae bacterium]